MEEGSIKDLNSLSLHQQCDLYCLCSVYADLWRRISHSRKKVMEVFHILINQVCLQPILESRYWHVGFVVLFSYLITTAGGNFLVSDLLEKMDSVGVVPKDTC